AVIAIENVRLFNETKEALEQQTATADVLKVISSSVADTAPVFDKILDSCHRLFESEQLGIFLVGDDNRVRVGAWHGSAFEGFRALDGHPMEETFTGRAIRERRTIQVTDAESIAGSQVIAGKAVKILGNYSAIYSPMTWESSGIGSICVFRQPPRPFSDKEVALLRTFADQAVIAIQNARLFNETKEALEQQKASAEVLGTISSSIADTKPVFDKILTSCERLFAGQVIAINLVAEDDRIHTVAYHGPAREKLERVHTVVPYRESSTSLAIASRAVLHYPDIENAQDVPRALRQAAGATGMKACIVAPMMWEGKGIGSIFVCR